MKTITASKISCYELCPRQFFFSYFLKLLQLPSKNLISGNIYHELLEVFHRDGEGKIGNVLDKYSPADREEAFNLFMRYRLNPVITEGVFECEKKFSLEIPGVEIPLHGKIDRVDSDKIIEYKTSSFLYKEEDIRTIQSRIYAYYMWIDGGKILPVIYSVINKKTKKPPQELRITYSEEELTKTPQIIADIYNKILENKFELRSGIHCRWCPFGKAGTENCDGI